MSFKNLKKIDIFRPKTPEADDYYEDFTSSAENIKKVIFVFNLFPERNIP